MEENLKREYKKIKCHVNELGKKIEECNNYLCGKIKSNETIEHASEFVKLTFNEMNEYQNRRIRLLRVLDCKHDFESLGKGKLHDNKDIEILKCRHCGIAKQLDESGYFTLGWWEPTT